MIGARFWRGAFSWRTVDIDWRGLFGARGGVFCLGA